MRRGVYAGGVGSVPTPFITTPLLRFRVVRMSMPVPSDPESAVHSRVEKPTREITFLNEAVHFGKQAIFIAIPKTGTSAVRQQLHQPGWPLIRNPHLDILQVRDALYIFLLQRTLGRNRVFPTSDHPSDADLRGRARQIFQTFFKFSAVRNPWARAVSLYHRREGVQVSRELSFPEFIRQHEFASDTCEQPTRHRNQVDWLCDESGNCLVDYVYKLEEFEQAIPEIAIRTNGRIQLTPLVANQNPESRSRDYRELYTTETRQLIAQRFEKDIDTFHYTF